MRTEELRELRELRELVEAATGPNRDLDGAICALLAPEINFRSDMSGFITESIDAALALVERLLPGTKGALYFNQEKAVAELDAPFNAKFPYVGEAATLALAIVSGLLSALEAQAE